MPVAKFTNQENRDCTLDAQVCRWFLHPPTINKIIPAMLVYYNSQVQGPDGIVDAAGEAEEELEAIMPLIQQSSMEGYLTK